MIPLVFRNAVFSLKEYPTIPFLLEKATDGLLRMPSTKRSWSIGISNQECKQYNLPGMNSDAFKDIEKLETDLWEAADNLRANSKLTSSDYFMPVLGVIFLRHAANRFDAAHRQIEADQASGKMPKRKVLPADYIARRSLYLPEKAQYDFIMQQATTSGADLPKLVTEAMTAMACSRSGPASRTRSIRTSFWPSRSFWGSSSPSSSRVTCSPPAEASLGGCSA